MTGLATAPNIAHNSLEINVLGSLVRYLAFALLSLVGPGVALQRAWRLSVDPLLVLPLGCAATAGAYWVSLVLGWPWLFPVLIGLFDLLALLPLRRFTLAPGVPPARLWAPVLVLLGLLAITQFPSNRFASSGEFLLDSFVTSDTAFHVGLTRELTLGYPPQVPGVAGFRLGYHLGADLVRAAALRWVRVDPYDCLARFEVTLAALALMLVLVGAARSLGAGPTALALLPWTLLLTDFSFLLAGSAQAHWWADLLRGNLLVSMFMANPIVPGLTLALASLVALDRHQKQEGRAWLLVAALLALSVPFFKVFLGAHLLGALLATAALRQSRWKEIAALAIPLLGATLALVAGQGGQTVEIAFAPLDLVQVTRESLGLPAATGGVLLLSSLVWIIASFGVRILGLPQAVTTLRQGPLVGTVLAVMALSAWPLGLLFRVSAPQVLPGQKVVNDAAFFVEQGGPPLWIFTALALARLAEMGRRGRLAVAVLLALSLPSSIQFVVKKALLATDPIPSATVRAMRALEAASRPGDIVLQRPGARFPPPPVILIGRRVLYERFTPYLTQFVPSDDLVRRHEALYRFFQTHDAQEALTIAHRLGASFLCLYGNDRVRFPADGPLQPIHDEPGARCYRISPPSPAAD